MNRILRIFTVALFSFVAFSCALEDAEITGDVVVDVDSSAMSSSRAAGDETADYFFAATLVNVVTGAEKVFSGFYTEDGYKKVNKILFENISSGEYRIKANLKRRNSDSIIYSGETGVFSINWQKGGKPNIALKMQLASITANSWASLQEYVNSASGYREIKLEGESQEFQNEIHVNMNSDNNESDPNKIVIGSGKTIKIFSVQEFEIIAARNSGKASTLFEVKAGGKLIIGDGASFKLTSNGSDDAMANSELISVRSGGILELKNVVIQGCAQYNNGAAIVAESGSTITAVSSEFISNKVTKFSGNGGEEIGASAGAVFIGNNVNATFTACKFGGNSAAFGPGGALFIDGDGSAVSAKVKFENCQFEDNIGLWGSVVTTKGYDVTFDGCTMKGNGVSTSTSAINACGGNVVLKSITMDSNQGTSNNCRDIQVGTDGEGANLLHAKVTLKGTAKGSSTSDKNLFIQYYNEYGTPVLIFDEDFVFEGAGDGKVKLFGTHYSSNGLCEIYFKPSSSVENTLVLIDAPQDKTLVKDSSTGKLSLQ